MEQKTLVEGDHLPGADRLPLLPGQRARLRARDREAARARDAAEGLVDAHLPVRAEPDPLAPRLARHGRARAGRDLDVLVLLPRARADPRPLRDGLRDAHAHALLPGRRARRGHPARVLPRGAASSPTGCRRRSTSTRRSSTGTRSGSSARSGSASSRPTTRSRSGSRARCCARSGVDWDLRRVAAVPLLRRVRLPRARLPRGRRLRPLPRAHGGDARVGEDHRAVPRPARGHGGRAVDRGRPQGRAAAARGAPHLDGVADPPLQDRHRGLPRPRGRGLRRPSSRRAASSAATSSPTAARGRGA